MAGRRRRWRRKATSGTAALVFFHSYIKFDNDQLTRLRARAVPRVRGRVSSRWKSFRRCGFALGGPVRAGIGRPRRRSPRDRRAFALTRRANLPSPSVALTPPASPLPRRRSASAWSSCARWASASSRRFVRRASPPPSRSSDAFSPRTRVVGTRSIFARALFSRLTFSPSALFLDARRLSPSDASTIIASNVSRTTNRTKGRGARSDETSETKTSSENPRATRGRLRTVGSARLRWARSSRMSSCQARRLWTSGGFEKCLPRDGTRRRTR